MNFFSHYLALIGLCLTPIISSAWPHQPFELSGQLGIANLHLGSATLAPTATEIDELHEASNVKTPEFGIGINNVLPTHLSWHYRQFQFLSYIKLGLNLRYVPQEVTGQVYQYEEQDMNNYQYTLSLDSTRLMLDAMLGIISFNEHSSFYLLGGVGRAWTSLNYQDMPNAGVNGGSLTLNKRTSTGFAYELGGGVTYVLSHDASLFLEYRYAHLPSLNSSSQGSLSGTSQNVTPAHFKFFSQTVAIGINWNI